jgi:hypothetical protein
MARGHAKAGTVESPVPARRVRVGGYFIAILLIDKIVADGSTQAALAAGASAAVGAAVGRWWILLVPPPMVLLLLVYDSVTHTAGDGEGGFGLAAVLAIVYVAVADSCLALGVTLRKLAWGPPTRNRLVRGDRSSA